MSKVSTKKSRKWCFVRECTNTTFKTPEKIFVTVPRDVKKRQKWFEAAKRDMNEVRPNCGLYCCEDHFNIKEDMENYIEYTLSKTKARMKPGVVPHLFACQTRDSTKKNQSSKTSTCKNYISENFIQIKEENYGTSEQQASTSTLDEIEENTVLMTAEKKNVACQTRSLHIHNKAIQVKLQTQGVKKIESGQEDDDDEDTKDSYPQTQAMDFVYVEPPKNRDSPIETTNVETPPYVDKPTQQDSCDFFGLYVAHKLRDYDTKVRAIVQHKINQVLFDADMGTFDSGSLSIKQEMSFSVSPPHEAGSPSYNNELNT